MRQLNAILSASQCEPADNAETIMFQFFKRRSDFDDQKKLQFIDAISTMLEVQLVMLGTRRLELADEDMKPEALGYIYGFIDGALRTINQDMADQSIGIPVTFQVLRRLFPGKERIYLRILSEQMGKGSAVTAGAMIGGQQYIDFHLGKLSAPMGLARCLLE